MKLYSLLILNKIQEHKKKQCSITDKLALFPRRILSCEQAVIRHYKTHTNHLRQHDQSKPHDYINSCRPTCGPIM